MAFTSPSTPAKPNADNILATLRRMPDNELLQYAQMHKNDPYIFPLTFQESNSRKQMRAEQAAQDNPTTKVVDKNLQEMAAPAPQMAQGMPPQQLPEDSGIGQLPAPNMQNFAAGGIVAFEDGGKVPGYQAGVFTADDALRAFLKQQGISGAEFLAMSPAKQAELRAAAPSPLPAAAPTAGVGTPKTMPAGLAATKAISAGMRKIPLLGLLYDAATPSNKEEERASFSYKLGAERAQAEANAQKAVANESPNDYAEKKVAELEAVSGKKLSPDARNMALSQFVQEKIVEQVERGKGKVGFTTSSAPPSKPFTGSSDVAAMANMGGPAPGGAGGAPAAPGGPAMPTMPAMGGLPSLGAAPKLVAPPKLNERMPTAGQAQGIAAQFLDEDKYAQQLKDLTNEEAASVAERRTKLEKSLKDMPERYKDYEGRLKAQEKEAEGDKEKLTGMSFLEAGLAVLSGESPHAFVNLGRAKEGVKTYNEGIKDIKRSARERDKAFGDIENARQAQAEGKIDTMNRFEDSAAKSMSDSRKFAVTGLQALGVKGAELASNAWNTATTNAYANIRTNTEQAGATDRTIATIAGQRDTALIGERGANARAVYGAEAQKFIHSLPGSQQKLFADLGGGNVEAGMKKYFAISGDQKQDTAMLTKYLDMKPMERMMFKRDNPGLAAQFDAMIQSKLPLTPVNVESARP
jgi:hypothetical protein